MTSGALPESLLARWRQTMAAEEAASSAKTAIPVASLRPPGEGEELACRGWLGPESAAVGRIRGSA
jgi:hypothetical protein